MENNNLNEQINENVVPTPEAEAKKPLPWWIFAAIGAGVVVIVAVVLILVLGGNKCKAHVDADDDYKCDVCGAKFDDGDEIAMLDVTITVKDSEGNAMAGVKFTVNENIELTTDANGVAKCAFMPAKYSITYDYSSFPSGFMPDTSTLYVSEGNENVTITIIDNNPNGSAARPYFISENVTPFTLSAGEELYYRCHAPVGRHLVINSGDVEVTYEGNTYKAEDGKVSFFIEGGIDEAISFSVKNVADAAVESAIEMIFPLGSRDNPIELTESQNTVNLESGVGIHYKWTATADGVLVLNCATEKSGIGISKVLANDVSISASVDGKGYAYLVVTKGEEITISVSNNAEEAQDISFTFKTYSGTESEPIPVLKNEIDISLLPSSSVCFMAIAGQFLTINNETNIIVSYNDTVEDSADAGYISLEFDADGIFTVTNTDTSINGITMMVE